MRRVRTAAKVCPVRRATSRSGKEVDEATIRIRHNSHSFRNSTL
jgi:hypothetical protein